jgi:hypothetical protein
MRSGTGNFLEAPSVPLGHRSASWGHEGSRSYYNPSGFSRTLPAGAPLRIPTIDAED